MPNLKSKYLIKICGITEAINASAIADFKPDYMGIISFQASPRFVSEQKMSDIFSAVNQKSKLTLVSVNQDLEQVIEICREHNFLAVQFHGDESEVYLKRFKEKCNWIEVFKAFRISESFDFKVLYSYTANSVNYFLFDTFHKSSLGGTGEAFDWEILLNYTGKISYFLSGGLDAILLKKAIKFAKKDERLKGFDFNSKLEYAPGIKNIAKVKEVMEMLHE